MNSCMPQPGSQLTVVETLVYIMQLSFSTGCVPDCFKIAKVILIFKTGDRTKFYHMEFTGKGMLKVRGGDLSSVNRSIVSPEAFCHQKHSVTRSILSPEAFCHLRVLSPFALTDPGGG